jgi:hypothetical protein
VGHPKGQPAGTWLLKKEKELGYRVSPCFEGLVVHAWCKRALHSFHWFLFFAVDSVCSKVFLRVLIVAKRTTLLPAAKTKGAPKEALPHTFWTPGQDWKKRTPTLCDWKLDLFLKKESPFFAHLERARALGEGTKKTPPQQNPAATLFFGLIFANGKADEGFPMRMQWTQTGFQWMKNEKNWSTRSLLVDPLPSHQKWCESSKTPGNPLLSHRR